MRLIIIIVFCFWGALSFSQWNSNPAVNTPVCVQPYNQVDVRVVTDSKGGGILSWTDYRSDSTGTNGDIYLQRIDKDGNIVWTLNGIAGCSQSAHQSAHNIVEDGYGGAIVAWVDSRNLNKDIYAQRVDSSGNVLWTLNGVAVDSKSNPQQDVKIISDASGGMIAVWQDSANGGYDIFAQRLDASGTQMWTPGGVVICNAAFSQINPKIEIDGNGGAIIVWQDKRNGVDYDIFAQRVNSSGVVQWTANGVAICYLPNTTQSNPKIDPDGSGGAIIAWQDKRNGADYNIYAQRVTSGGSVSWTSNGVPVCMAIGSQSAIDVNTNGVGGAMISWKDSRSGFFGIYAQKIDWNGVAQWTTNGIAVATGNKDQINPNLIGDMNGGGIVVWQDSTASGLDIYAARVDAAGNIAWSNPVGIAIDKQVSPKSVIDGSGGAIFVWADKRNTTDYDVYAHHLFWNGTTNGVYEYENYFQTMIFPNPVKTSGIIKFDAYEKVIISFFNVIGEEIKIPFAQVTDGIRINVTDIKPGIYAYRIAGEDRLGSGKFIVR